MLSGHAVVISQSETPSGEPPAFRKEAEECGMADRMTTRTVRITGQGGDEIEAYLAEPTDAERRAGVVVIHHMPGYDPATNEIVHRFPSTGSTSAPAAPDYRSRYACHVIGYYQPIRTQSRPAGLGCSG
jgi:hypothetical protein